MKKLPSSVMILITAVFLSFALGFFLGRNTGHSPVRLATVTEAETQTSPALTEAATNPAVTETEAGEAPVTLSATEPAESTTPGSGRININTATVQELDTLPGIGPVLAQRIYDFRQANGPFSTVEELIRVSGIGEKKLEAILELITVE